MAATRDFVALSSVVCMARCDNKFVLPALPIAENLQRCDRALCTTCKGKEVPYGCSYNDEWFLDSGVSAHFTPFKSDFVSMTQGNYGCIETANSKASLFMVAVGTVRATGHKTPGESSVILQSVVMIQLTSRRILRD